MINQPCAECKIYKATLEFASQGTMMALRGWGRTPLCEACFIPIMEKERDAIDANIKRHLLEIEKNPPTIFKP